MKMFILFFILLMFMLIITTHFIPSFFYRSMPNGLCSGQLDMEKPNWVSSMVNEHDSHYIKPLGVNDPVKLSEIISKGLKNIHIKQVNDSAMVGYRESNFFHFVDWFCIKSNGDVISSATMGYYDFGQNRKLIERIRALTNSDESLED